MKKICSCLLAAFLALTGLAQTPFELHGEVDPSLNDTYVYLYGIDWSKLNPGIQDSCRVKDARFVFKGSLHTPGMLASLYTKNSRNAFTQLYIQPGNMQVVLKGTNWYRDENVSTRHAFVNDQFRELRAQTKGKENELVRLRYVMDSLRSVQAEASIPHLRRAADSLDVQITGLQKEYVRNHAGNYMSLVLLCYFLKDKVAFEELKSLYAGLSGQLKNLEEGKRLQERIHAMDALQTGRRAPEFALTDTAGKIVRLGDHQGYYVLLDFWASWCRPCLQQVPALKKFYADNRHQKLRIIGVSLDEDKTKWLSAIRQYNLNWQHVSDLGGWKSIVCRLYNVEAIPKNILLDPAGNIVGIDINLEKHKL